MGEEIKAILVGNKADLEKEVTKEDIDELIKSMKIRVVDYIETSAKTAITSKNSSIKSLRRSKRGSN